MYCLKSIITTGCFLFSNNYWYYFTTKSPKIFKFSLMYSQKYIIKCTTSGYIIIIYSTIHLFISSEELIIIFWSLLYIHVHIPRQTPRSSVRTWLLGGRRGETVCEPKCLTAFKKDLAKRHSATAKQNNKLFCETRSCRNGLALPKKKPLWTSVTLSVPRLLFHSLSGIAFLYLFVFIFLWHTELRVFANMLFRLPLQSNPNPNANANANATKVC